MAALFHGAMGFGGMGQGEALVDDGADGLGGHEGPDFCVDLVAEGALFGVGTAAQVGAGEDEALEHDGPQVEVDGTALSGGDVGEAAVLREEFEVLLEVWPGDHIEDAVEARGRPGLQLLGPVGVVVHGVFCAELKAPGAFVCRAGCCCCVDAAGAGHLQCHGPDAAGAALHEEALALEDARGCCLAGSLREEIGPDGEDGLGQRGGIGERKILRDFEAGAGVGDGELGVAAAGEECADAVAKFPLVALGGEGADLVDFARDFEAQYF